MSLSWLLTLLGLVLSVLGTVIILRWPTYVTPIVQDKNKKWVRLFAWTSDAERSVFAHFGFSAPSRGIRPDGLVLVMS